MTDEIAELFNLEIDEFNKKPKVSYSLRGFDCAFNLTCN